MERVKIVVFVPLTHVDKIRQVVSENGAGIIGNYDNCSFSSKGTGRFRPLEGANPNIGAVDKIEAVEEERIEFVCPKSKAKEVIEKMKEAHPYEEVAFDVYPLINEEDL